MENFRAFWVIGFIGFLGLVRFANGDKDVDANALMVPLTLIQSASSKGAYCLDGSAPAYHFSPGFGSGANSWIIDLEGGGWCNDKKTCEFRKKTRHGSSTYMEKQIAFTGVLSNKPDENPDFYNWNRARIRYCDGGSFASEGYDQASNLNFRGQRIWSAAMDEMMSKGMRNANQVLLSGCSAGGLAVILHCDQFRALFPSNIKVKCLADAGMFLDATDVSGGRTMRNFYKGVVDMLGVSKNLPSSCTSRMDANSCIFPENVIANIQTPIFILNAAYDVWQIQESLAPGSADPNGEWRKCRLNYTTCTSSQIQFLQGFRNRMVSVLQSFSQSRKNGVFLNSCFAHCQSGVQDIWYANDSPVVQNKGIAKSVGDWYFDRAEVNLIDCPYPCDKTCHNVIHNLSIVQQQFSSVEIQAPMLPSAPQRAPISLNPPQNESESPSALKQESESPTAPQQEPESQTEEEEGLETPTVPKQESESSINRTASSWSSTLEASYVIALLHLVGVLVHNIVL